jgi:DNA-binding transcriptional LysR family regulator
MEFNQVRYFLALCETLNFTRAAENCNVTQPSLTRAIHALEQEFGGPLLHRERNRTHLTDLGNLVRPYLEQVFHQSRIAKERAKSFTMLESATLDIGIMCTLAPHMMMNLMATFHAEHPGIEISLRDANIATLQAQLDSGELDVALMCFPRGVPDAYHALSLYQERFLIAFASGHPFEQLNTVRAQDLDGQHYLGRINCEYGEYMREVYRELGVELTRPYRSERDDWIQTMAAAGLGFSFIPESCVTLKGLVTRPLTEPEVVRTVSLVTVRGRPHSSSVGAFVRATAREKWHMPVMAA